MGDQYAKSTQDFIARAIKRQEFLAEQNSSDPYEPWVCLAKYGRLKQNEIVLRELLQQPYCNVNAVDPTGATALLFAAGFCNTYSSLDVLDLLLEHPGIHVNHKDKEKMSALHYACRYGDNTSCPEAVEKLLAIDAIDVNLRGKDDATPLISLLDVKPDSHEFRFRILNLLLAHTGTRVNCRDRHGNTPLSYALRRYFEYPQHFNALMAHPDICVYQTAYQTINYSRYSVYAKVLFESICERLECDQFRRLRLPSISGLSQDLQERLKTAIINTRRLRHLSMCEKDDIFGDIAIQNASITSFDSKMSVLNGIVNRNLQGYAKCQKAALYAAWFLKPLVNKDVARLIAELVWETRGTKAWIY